MIDLMMLRKDAAGDPAGKTEGLKGGRAEPNAERGTRNAEVTDPNVGNAELANPKVAKAEGGSLSAVAAIKPINALNPNL